MTNLLEKSLLLGFSIFLLTVFFAILTPFLEEFTEYNENEKNELGIYIEFLDEINEAVLYIIQSPEESYLQDIHYPSNLNLTFYDSFIIRNVLEQHKHKLYDKFYSLHTEVKDYFDQYVQ